MSFLIVLTSLAMGALPGSDQYLAGHEFERGAKYAPAISAYETCAEREGPLAPYARLKAAYCRGASGDRGAAIEAYQRLIADAPKGPWVRMAQIQLASWQALEKRWSDAVRQYDQALAFDPKPWWVDRYDKLAAETHLESPESVSRGYAFFRDLAATTWLRAPRLEAAARLAQSPSQEDKLAAALAYVRSSECPEALKILNALAPVMVGEAPLVAENGHAGAQAGNGDAAARLRGFAAAHSGNDWVRVWLAYVARAQNSAETTDVAMAACDALLERYPQSDEAAEALWSVANQLAKGDNKDRAIDAYLRLARQCPRHSRADDALFAAGELQRGAGQTQTFVKTFMALNEQYPASPYVPKSWYWMGCAQEKAGDKRAAAQSFREAVKRGLGSFYGHRALQRLTDMKDKTPVGRALHVADGRAFLRALPLPPNPPAKNDGKLFEQPRFERLRFFAMHGMEEAEWEALDLAESLRKGEHATAIYQALAEAGVACTAMNYAQAFRFDTSESGETGFGRRCVDYPRAYWPLVQEMAGETGLDPYLILSVARQESTFRPALVSYAGAVGVMQLMPGTAKHLAKTDPGLNADDIANLESPVKSLRLGAHYLRRMLDRCNGNVAYALASYNAGPGNCDKWRKQFGQGGLEAFIESIPFAETRDYVKRVLGNYAAYYSLYPAVDPKSETVRK